MPFSQTFTRRAASGRRRSRQRARSGGHESRQRRLSGTPTQAGGSTSSSWPPTRTAARAPARHPRHRLPDHQRDEPRRDGGQPGRLQPDVAQTGAIGPRRHPGVGSAPVGPDLAPNGLLSGATAVGIFDHREGHGRKPSAGTGATCTLVVGCQTISSRIRPRPDRGLAFSQTFTQTGALGPATFTTASPRGVTLASGVSQHADPPGTFPIVVTVTDVNGYAGQRRTSLSSRADLRRQPTSVPPEQLARSIPLSFKHARRP